MRRFLFITYSILISLVIVASCSKNNKDNGGAEYIISGTVIASDSVETDSVLRLYIDKHGEFLVEELHVANGQFEYRGRSHSVDELFFELSGGPAPSIFVKGGTQVALTISADSIVEIAEADSLNLLYRQIVAQLDTLRDSDRKKLLDSVCVEYRNTIVPSLVIRDRMHVVGDSVFVRQCLGRLKAEAKPAWIVADIEKVFDRADLYLKKNKRLDPLPYLRTDIDSIIFDFPATRANSTLIYFWAEYNKESVDSLQILTPLAKKYGLEEYISSFKSKGPSHRPKRVDILTICLSAPDSAAWRQAIKDIPGRHVLLQDGFSNLNIKRWNIKKVPYNIIIDRFSNVSDSYHWGKELQEAIERQPNNFTYIANGSNNNNRISARH